MRLGSPGSSRKSVALAASRPPFRKRSIARSLQSAAWYAITRRLRSRSIARIATSPSSLRTRASQHASMSRHIEPKHLVDALPITPPPTSPSPTVTTDGDLPTAEPAKGITPSSGGRSLLLRQLLRHQRSRRAMWVVQRVEHRRHGTQLLDRLQPLRWQGWMGEGRLNEHQDPQETHRSRAAARCHQRRRRAREIDPARPPSTLHLWWARRPLAAARAVIFAQMVNDPGYQQGGGFRYGVNKERPRWSASDCSRSSKTWCSGRTPTTRKCWSAPARRSARSWRETCELNKGHPQAAELFNPDKLPAFHDPVCRRRRHAAGSAAPWAGELCIGPEPGGSDDQQGDDRNPADALPAARRWGRCRQTNGRTSCMKTGPAHGAGRGRASLWRVDARRGREANRPPVPEDRGHRRDGRRASRPEAAVGQKLTVIAWLWARTVKSPNPAFSHVDVPLASPLCCRARRARRPMWSQWSTGDQLPIHGEGGHSHRSGEGRAPRQQDAGRTSAACCRRSRSAATTSRLKARPDAWARA